MTTNQKIKAISALTEALKLYVDSVSLSTPMQEYRDSVKAMSDKIVELTKSIDVNGDDTRIVVKGMDIVEPKVSCQSYIRDFIDELNRREIKTTSRKA